MRTGGHFSISSDGWSITHGEPIINYMAKHSVCHGFHLLVKDILEFVPELQEVVEITKDMILFVFRHHKVLCELK